MLLQKTDNLRRNRPLAPLDMTRVLVAGDDNALLHRTKRILETRGYDVSLSGGAHDTRQLARAIAWAGRRSPIELLLFVATKNTRAALGIIEHLRRSNWALPVILITDHDDDVKLDARRIGVDEVVELPLDDSTLVQAALELAPIVPDVEASPAA